MLKSFSFTNHPLSGVGAYLPLFIYVDEICIEMRMLREERLCFRQAHDHECGIVGVCGDGVICENSDAE